MHLESWGEGMCTDNYIEIDCIQISQPIGTFYLGVMNAKDLCKISFKDIRSLYGKTGDLHEYMGIQRELTPKRVKDLRKYVTTMDATFPTGVILSISPLMPDGTLPSSDDDEFVIRFDPTNRRMLIRNDEDVAKIIDGQHRIEGLREYELTDFQINVVIFVDMAIEDQANVFATINLQQTKVNKSLAYDLLEYASKRSPQKTCHDIVTLLNKRVESPFLGKIMILGKAEGANETITQATFIDRLLKYVSNDPSGDRDMYRRGKQPARADTRIGQRLIFRNLFLNKEDAVIARIVWNYFLAVQSKWPESWDFVERGNILNRTTGFGALMRFLRVAYLNVQKDSRGLVEESAFSRVFDKITLLSTDFTPDRFKPGSSGEAELYKELVTEANLGEPQQSEFPLQG